MKKPILDLKKLLMEKDPTPTARKTWPYWVMLALAIAGVLIWSLLIAH